ncbi:MAG: hypothetical protein ACYS22_13375 [Planctomycetota bacterium]
MPERIAELSAEVADICTDMKWECHVFDGDWTRPAVTELAVLPSVTEVTGHLALKGVTFSPHSECESVQFLVDAAGVLRSIPCVGFDWISVKTQFAPPEIHVAVVRLLRYLKKRYLPSLEVRDEGGYWATGDLDALRGKLEFVGCMIDQVAADCAAIAEAGPSTGTSGKLERLTEALRRRCGGSFDATVVQNPEA